MTGPANSRTDVPEGRRSSTSAQRTEAVLDRGAMRELIPETVSSTREASPVRLQKRLRGDLDFVLLKALRKEPAPRSPSTKQVSALIQETRRSAITSPSPTGIRAGFSTRGVTSMPRSSI